MSLPLDTFASSVHAFVRHTAMFRPGERVILAVSGGTDSLSMLHCLATLAADLDLRLHVAHVHHGLRGADADADAAFVLAQAAILALPCSVLKVDVQVVRARRESLEAAARRERYRALRSLAASFDGACIATGHTLDDQAETLLLHLIRGAGLDGLAGMRPRRNDLARPLLAMPHAETVAYCRARDLAPRQDRTNDELRFRRNAIRHDLLPRLQAYNGRVVEALARSAALLADDGDYVRQQAGEKLAALRCPTGNGNLALRVDGYTPLPIALRRQVVRQAVAQTIGTTEGLRAEHVEAIDNLLMSGKAGRRWQMPRCLHVELVGNQAIFIHAPLPRSSTAEWQPVVLQVPGSCQFGTWQITARIERHNEPPPPGAEGRYFTVRCDLRAISGLLTVRGKVPGDRVRPIGLPGTKKVQDLFVDRKVPRAERASIPIISDDAGIVWIVGHALDARAWVDPGSTGVVVLDAVLDAEQR